MKIDEDLTLFLAEKQKSKKAKVSIFENYRNEIFYLRENNMEIKDILEFLVTKRNIKATYVNLQKWLARQEKPKREKPSSIDNRYQDKDEISELQITKEVKKAPETIFVLPDVPKKSSGEMKKYDTSKIERSGSADLLRACTKK